MRLLVHGTRLLFNRFILSMSNGKALRLFVEKMGLAYIKLAQILAMQNIGNIFTESDRLDLLHICDDCNPVPFRVIDNILHEEYGAKYNRIIKKIKHKQVGSASVSQVHYAVLTSGEKVVFKVKRKDVDKTVRKDIKTIRFLMKYFGWVVGFKNVTGGNRALDDYTDWILQELDFDREVKNIIRYRQFANSVNGKLDGYKNIVMPKVYTEYCTPNVICMEYVPYDTISNMPINKQTEEKIIKGIESYVCLSFYALLHDMPVVFHGDPHAGNIYIDNNGNVGFLDMGLMFELSSEDEKRTRHLFFLAYFQQADKLYQTLEFGLKCSAEEMQSFKDDVKSYCSRIPNMPVTDYFMDLVIVCMRYNICPDDFLFGMAKAFVCLSGIDVIYKNKMTGRELLMTQVIDYILRQLSGAGRKFIRNIFRADLALLTLDKNLLLETIKDNIYVILDLIE